MSSKRNMNNNLLRPAKSARVDGLLPRPMSARPEHMGTYRSVPSLNVISSKGEEMRKRTLFIGKDTDREKRNRIGGKEFLKQVEQALEYYSGGGGDHRFGRRDTLKSQKKLEQNLNTSETEIESSEEMEEFVDMREFLKMQEKVEELKKENAGIQSKYSDLRVEKTRLVNALATQKGFVENYCGLIQNLQNQMEQQREEIKEKTFRIQHLIEQFSLEKNNKENSIIAFRRVLEQ